MSVKFSADQAAAITSFDEFAASRDETVFALLGYAGTGKSFTYAQMAKHMQGQVVLAAPTHKAVNVLRRNLRAAGVDFEEGFDRQLHVPGRLVTGTTAQMIGLAPVIDDDQTSDKMTFGKAGSGVLGQIGNVAWIVIDEVSMLSQPHLDLIEAQAMKMNAKILVLGDPGQLPPVNAEPLAWDEFPRVGLLQQIMRQADGSAIPLLAQAVREEGDWRAVSGAGVTHTDFPGRAFLDDLTLPGAAEKDRSVFIAYTNRVVNEVQELACQELYGHGRDRFEADQVVISESRIEAEISTYLPKYGRYYPRMQVAANNADEMRVLAFGEPGRYGTMVELERIDRPEISFVAEYLPPEDRSNPRHPYNVDLQNAFAAANALQSEWKAAGMPRDNGLDQRRKNAWSSAFGLRDRTVVSFRHPFALTSHRSQGSTYKRAFVDAADIERFDARGLYVAATRPAEELVIG